MSKFKKLLMLMLTVAVLLTVFCVVAFADEPRAPHNISNTGGASLDLDFQSYGEGHNIVSSTTKRGKLSVKLGDDGVNKYVLSEYKDADSGSSTSSISWDIHAMYSNRNVYNTKDYPIMSFDFDIMTEDGTFGDTSNNSAYITPRTYYSTGTVGDQMTRINFASLGLNKTPFLWQHVSLVFEYVGDGLFNVYCFVNGSTEPTYTATRDISSGAKYLANASTTTMHMGNFLMYCARFKGSTYDCDIGFDNFQFTYFPEGYSVEDVATYIYDGDYELPFGKTVAKVGDVVYDNIYEAMDAGAESGETVELAANVSTKLVIDRPITIEKGEFTANFAYTNGLTMTEEGTTVVFSEYTDYDLALILEDGSVEGYYAAPDYSKAFTNAMTASGSIIKLNRNIEVSDSIAIKGGSNFVFDLNGKTFTRCNIYGDVYNKDATGEYVKASTGISKAKEAFTVGTSAKKINFTITSSVEGAKFNNVVMKSKIYNDENGVRERVEGVSLEGGGFIYTYGPIGITINVSNIDVYSLNLLYAPHGGTSEFTFNVDNVNFYRTAGDEKTTAYGYSCLFIESASSYNEINVSNSLIYICPDDILGGDFTRIIRIQQSGNKTKATFNNCDIISDNPDYAVWKQSTAASITFNGCRIYNVKNTDEVSGAIMGNGTIYSSSMHKLSLQADGHLSMTSENEKEYDLPTNHRFTIDSETKQLVSKFDFDKRIITFDYEIKTKEELGVSYDNPAMLSMIYDTTFRLRFYVPAETVGLEIDTVYGYGFVQIDNVMINGVEYECYEKNCTTTGVSDLTPVTIGFTKNEISYSQTTMVSALVYAGVVLSDENTVELEKSAVGNMVRYIKEAKGLATAEEFDSLIEASGIADYDESYTSDIENSNIEALSAYIKSINFVVTSGKASYKLTHTEVDPADVSNIKVYLGDKELKLTKGQGTSNKVVTSTYLTVESQRVYDIIEPITIKVIDADGAELVATYSILENINATESNLVKALYEFAVAAKAYREYAITQDEAQA